MAPLVMVKARASGPTETSTVGSGKTAIIMAPGASQDQDNGVMKVRGVLAGGMALAASWKQPVEMFS